MQNKRFGKFRLNISSPGMLCIMIPFVLSFILHDANKIHGYDFPCEIESSSFNIFSSLVLKKIFPPTKDV